MLGPFTQAMLKCINKNKKQLITKMKMSPFYFNWKQNTCFVCLIVRAKWKEGLALDVLWVEGFLPRGHVPLQKTPLEVVLCYISE